MPLPSVARWAAPQCRAKAKHSGTRCQNPAAHGMPVCRVHGARLRHTIKRGPHHPAFIHGEETLAAKRERSAMLTELRDIEAALFALGVIEGPRWPGRKPVRS